MWWGGNNSTQKRIEGLKGWARRTTGRDQGLAGGKDTLRSVSQRAEDPLGHDIQLLVVHKRQPHRGVLFRQVLQSAQSNRRGRVDLNWLFTVPSRGYPISDGYRRFSGNRDRVLRDGYSPGRNVYELGIILSDLLREGRAFSDRKRSRINSGDLGQGIHDVVRILGELLERRDTNPVMERDTLLLQDGKHKSVVERGG